MAPTARLRERTEEEEEVSWRRKPVLVEVRGDGGGSGGLDVGRRGEVGEALGEVDGADRLDTADSLRSMAPPLCRCLLAPVFVWVSG